MTESTARQLAGYLDARITATRSDYAVGRIGGSTPLLGFHVWADGKPLIAAYQLRRDEAELRGRKSG